MEVKLNELPKKAIVYEKALEEAIDTRLRAKALEEEAKQLKELADVMFMSISEATGILAVESASGTIRVVEKAGAAKLDKGKVKDYLIKKGVDSELVLDAFDKATTTGKPSKSVGFFPPKDQ